MADAFTKVPHNKHNGGSPYLYLELGRGLSGLMRGGEALRSESDSETGLRGLEAAEEVRGGAHFCAMGEERGSGSTDRPERLLGMGERKRQRERVREREREHVREGIRIILHHVVRFSLIAFGT